MQGRTSTEAVNHYVGITNFLVSCVVNVSMCSDSVRLSVQRFCPFVSPPLLMSATRTAACPSAGQSARMVQYNPADYTSLFWLNPILNHYQHTLEIPDCARGNTRQPNFVVT